MNAKSSPPVLVQILSGILWITAALALVACLSARYRLADAGLDSLPRAEERGETPDDLSAEDPVATDDQTIVAVARPTGSWHAPSSRHGIYLPRPPVQVPVIIPAEPVVVTISRRISTP